MENEKDSSTKSAMVCKCKNYHASQNSVYGLGFIGALVYFLQHASTFQAGIIGLLKAIIWPALFVYKLLGYLNM